MKCKYVPSKAKQRREEKNIFSPPKDNLEQMNNPVNKQDVDIQRSVLNIGHS